MDVFVYFSFWESGMKKFDLESNLLFFLKSQKDVIPILKVIEKSGGVPYLVGGSIRDLILNRSLKDIDIEVHKLTLEDLQKCLGQFGEVKLVGKQFGVLRIGGFDVDWSIPRKDSKGRKPKVELDPDMSIEDACLRRDVTINAMAIDLCFFLGDAKDKLEILDPYGGLQDLQDKKLRVVDEKLFLDDPLRFYRVMQFVGRFEMNPDEKLTKICKKMSLKGVARERIYEELQKLFLKSRRPSLGIRWLKEIGRLKEILPEVYALIGVVQRKDYHPEGDVFEHTMQALDAAAVLAKYEEREEISKNAEKLMVMFAILCHDFGKVDTIDDKLQAIGHEKVGVDIAVQFLKRFTDNSFLIKSVKKLILYHLAPLDFLDQRAGVKAYKRLAFKLSPEVTLRHLALVALSDARGRNKESNVPLESGEDEFEEFMNNVKEALLEKGPEKPVLLGRHLFGIVPPGPEMGKLLKKAYEIQIEEGIKDVEELKNRILSKS